MSTVSGTASSASPPAAKSQQQTQQQQNQQNPQNQQQQHTRTYQACIPCRRRKVRCDLGPVDNPHDPPCVRCRRESKECYFSATRRKRKTDAPDDDELDDAPDDYEIRNGRKRVRTAPEPLHLHRADSVSASASGSLPASASAYAAQPLTPGGSVGRYEPLRRPHPQAPGHGSPHGDEQDDKVNNETAAILQTKEVYSGHDALNLLFEAAGHNGDMDHHHRTSSASSHQRPALGAPASTPGSQAAFASPRATAYHARSTSRAAPDHHLDPAIAHQHPAPPPHHAPAPPEPRDEAAFAEAVRAWSRFRFVRAGWLTAKEAVAYIDYFYTYLSPLTPIVVPDYRDHALHGKLLKEEPMLVVTLLTIASRFLKPETSAGAISRSYLIHEKFWKYLQGMIDRMIYGQEQFGGGFCGAGQQPGSDVNPLSRKGLRTLGTVESLMLLTEWHPRALHFPPGDDDDELVLPDDPLETYSTPATHQHVKAVGGQRIDSWLEPCWRSDRMCWMLLGNATALAFEIGVFDETSENDFEEANSHLSHATVKAYFRRKNHLKDLLLVYVTQTSGRLGLTSMLPKVGEQAIAADNTKWPTNPNQLYQERITRIKPPPPNSGMRPDGQRLPYESVATQHRHAVQDLVLDFWNIIAQVMERGNNHLFANRQRTRELLKSGRYEVMLREFQGPLKRWRADFDSTDRIPTQLRHVLTIEYEYTRVYLNSLALQAVVERCAHATPQQYQAQQNGMGASGRPNGDGAIPFSTLVKWYGNDRQYIDEVIHASRNVLRVVVEGLFPGDYLRHAPVRTFFRIVSVAIILLKTFALGATEDDVATSLTLLDRAVEALRTSIVDDVHVGNRFADLVETLTHRIRSRFVRLAANGGSTGISRAGSRSPTRGQTPMMGPPPQPFQQQGHLQAPFPNSVPNALPTFQGTGSSVPGSPSLGVTASGRQTPNQALWGISSEPYDTTSNKFSIMPPPSYSTTASNPNGYDWSSSNANAHQFNGTGSAHANAGFDWNIGDQDWLALPLDPLLNQYDADITQTAMGPDVGGMDMLDILLNMGGPPGSA